MHLEITSGIDACHPTHTHTRTHALTPSLLLTLSYWMFTVSLTTWWARAHTQTSLSVEPLPYWILSVRYIKASFVQKHTATAQICPHTQVLRCCRAASFTEESLIFLMDSAVGGRTEILSIDFIFGRLYRGHLVLQYTLLARPSPTPHPHLLPCTIVLPLCMLQL